VTYKEELSKEKSCVRVAWALWPRSRRESREELEEKKIPQTSGSYCLVLPHVRGSQVSLSWRKETIRSERQRKELGAHKKRIWNSDLLGAGKGRDMGRIPDIKGGCIRTLDHRRIGGGEVRGAREGKNREEERGEETRGGTLIGAGSRIYLP